MLRLPKFLTESFFFFLLEVVLVYLFWVLYQFTCSWSWVKYGYKVSSLESLQYLIMSYLKAEIILKNASPIWISVFTVSTEFCDLTICGFGVIYVTYDKQRTISFSLTARQMSWPQILISQCKYHQNISHLLCFSYYIL